MAPRPSWWFQRWCNEPTRSSGPFGHWISFANVQTFAHWTNVVKAKKCQNPQHPIRNQWTSVNICLAKNLVSSDLVTGKWPQKLWWFGLFRSVWASSKHPEKSGRLENLCRFCCGVFVDSDNGWTKNHASDGLHSGNDCYIAIEHGHRNSEFSIVFPLNMVVFHSYVNVYQRVSAVSWRCQTGFAKKWWHSGGAWGYFPNSHNLILLNNINRGW